MGRVDNSTLFCATFESEGGVAPDVMSSARRCFFRLSKSTLAPPSVSSPHLDSGQGVDSDALHVVGLWPDTIDAGPPNSFLVRSCPWRILRMCVCANGLPLVRMASSAITKGRGESANSISFSSKLPVVMFWPGLAWKPLALAWPTVALAWWNPRPGQKPETWLGLAWLGLSLGLQECLVSLKHAIIYTLIKYDLTTLLVVIHLYHHLCLNNSPLLLRQYPSSLPHLFYQILVLHPVPFPLAPLVLFPP